MLQPKDIIARFESWIYDSARQSPAEKGALLKAFTYRDARGKRIIRHPETFDAYADLLRDFKILHAIMLNLPFDNLSSITNQYSGSFRLVLHLYLHASLPDYPEKQDDLKKHRKSGGANHVMNSIRDQVEAWLDSGRISDQSYAARLRDDQLLISFVKEWLANARLRG
jgi:hypothetical protein